MKQENKLLPGSLFCLLIGAAAWVMANYIPTVGKLIGGPVFAILLGMILAFWKRPSAIDAGITFCSKKILQYSIIFIRFLYKGIIINHNKKLSQPTLKRRFFKKKAAFFSWPGLGKEWC